MGGYAMAEVFAKAYMAWSILNLNGGVSLRKRAVAQASRSRFGAALHLFYENAGSARFRLLEGERPCPRPFIRARKSGSRHSAR